MAPESTVHNLYVNTLYISRPDISVDNITIDKGYHQMVVDNEVPVDDVDVDDGKVLVEKQGIFDLFSVHLL